MFLKETLLCERFFNRKSRIYLK